MKRSNKAIYFISGMLTTLLLVSMITPALAAGRSKYIEVSTGVSAYVDDVKLDPRDANGNPVEVFIYNGTTYLPVRAVSEALEVPVQWDGSTRSVYVGKHTGNKPVAWLANMDYFSGTPDNDCYILDSEDDNIGDTHYHCIVSGNSRVGNYMNYEFNRTYLINGKYSKITGTIYQTYIARSKATADSYCLKIYGDNELLYDCSFSEGETGVKPIAFDVDLTGVLELKVIFKGSCARDGHILSLGDVGLWT